MEFQAYTSPTAMLNKVEEYLMQQEAINNLPLGLLYRLTEDEKQRKQIEPLLAVGEKDGLICFVMVQTSPSHYLIVCGQEGVSANAASWIVENNYVFPGVVGCSSVVNSFVKELGDMLRCKVELSMKQRIYLLDQLIPVPRSNGRLCYATEDDIALVTLWIQYFHREALHPIDRAQAEEFAKREVKSNRIFLWRNVRGTPVSMAKRARETKHGIVINLVYTPDEYKNQGYATTCVSSLSERLLQEGFSFCTLYTDLANPTSNSIYMKIGYKPIADSVEYRLIW
ncbi:GNAT family N-acetyltransferase [Evansella tamaricis]|uniref:GNAT family N-acetyltransferase n=1 Tax=Evansella tamaricis TaxID=2069301 RepID=A0ABS6JBV6_9BACI|nr:GNAT family N-acetyltransferase [Evansella tamaricis]MBU9711156.1 GNAT family N-acetyltransferase [Evansella tamaricis]